MDKIKINLLPPEIKEQARKASKQSLINRISVGLLGLLILVTSGILGVVIFQTAVVNDLNSTIEQEKSRLASLGESEAVMKLLKNRIDTINQFDTKTYKQGAVYKLLGTLIPPGVNVNVIKVNKTQTVTIQADTRNTAALQTFLDNLVDAGKNESKINSVTIETMSRNAGGDISFELGVNLKEGVL